jgi:predicted ribonuclease YlaK
MPRKKSNKLEAEFSSSGKVLSDPESKKKKLQQLISGRKHIKSKNPRQEKLIKLIHDKNIELIIVAGAPGTGKTFVTLSECLNLLMNDFNSFNELLIFKSVTILKGEEIGFLPGDTKEKMQFFLLSYFIQIEKLIGRANMEKLIDQEFVKIIPLGFIRGVSITPNQIIIVDEFQNISVENVKTILTRMEEGSKLICLGDIEQQDSKGQNGLKFLVEHFKEIDSKIAVLEFEESDIVRNPLITKILKVFGDKK